MNYRHIYHAGNFADLLKHAVLIELLRRLTGSRPPLTVVDTHAGAGLYDLEDPQARRTGEGLAGVGRLMVERNAPAVFDPLKAAVAAANSGGAVRFYPGSPLIVAHALRARDRYVGCETRPDDAAALRAAMPGRSRADIVKEDGWTVAVNRAPPGPASLLLLIDPPFERGDDVAQVINVSQVVQKRNPGAVIAVWTPIKDLTAFDAIVMAFADAVGPAATMIVEVRLRPLTDPMMLNGCAMIVSNPPGGVDEPCGQAAAWIARTLGEAGGLGRVERILSAS
jgi:23S rRNA (adenine2030-N6)-methyltransferase